MKTTFLAKEIPPHLDDVANIVEGPNRAEDAAGISVASQPYNKSALLSILTRERTPNARPAKRGYDARVFHLTREVRLKVATGFKTGSNGHAGTPAVDGAYVPVDVRVTLQGNPDPASGYVRNIKDVDDRVKALALPVLQQRLAAVAGQSLADLTADLFRLLADQWSGVVLTRLGVRLSPATEYHIFASEVDVPRLSHRFEFSAAHRLHNPDLSEAENKRLFGKCNNPLGHGHNYEVQVTLKAKNGAFPPLAELERLVDQHAIDRLDHKNLNLEVEPFQTINPSVEQIAQVVYGWLKTPLTIGDASLDAVTVWETPRTWCEYSE